MVLTHENKDAGADVEKRGGRPGHQDEDDADEDKKMNCCTCDTAAAHYYKNYCARLMIMPMGRPLL